MFDFAIIGGGASGMYASILLAQKGYKVALLEANDRVGKKLLATGNGKCNLSNVDMGVQFYNTDKIDNIILQFDLAKEFLKLGLVTKVKSGRIYPFSEQANNVLNVFLLNMKKFGVQVFCNLKAQEIFVDDNVCIKTNGADILCKKVCLAVGSNASFGLDSTNLYEKFLHKTVKKSPSLSPMLAQNPMQIKGLNGVRQEAEVSLFSSGKLMAKEFGEVQFKKDGVSGIVVMNLSAKANWYNVKSGQLVLDFMPEYTSEQVKNLMQNQITSQFGLLNKNIMQNVSVLGEDSVKNYKIDVAMCKDIKQAQVLSGGLDLKDFNLDNMQSKLCDKLYAIGEAVDVDGVCGGYNLHWAFASAFNFAKEF